MVSFTPPPIRAPSAAESARSLPTDHLFPAGDAGAQSAATIEDAAPPAQAAASSDKDRPAHIDRTPKWLVLAALAGLAMATVGAVAWWLMGPDGAAEEQTVERTDKNALPSATIASTKEALPAPAEPGAGIPISPGIDERASVQQLAESPKLEVPEPESGSAPTPAIGPGRTLAMFHRDIDRGDIERAAGRLHEGALGQLGENRLPAADEGAVKASLQKLHRTYKNNGGIVSTKVRKSSVAGERASVSLVYVMGNGTVFREQRDMFNVNGTWKAGPVLSLIQEKKAAPVPKIVDQGDRAARAAKTEAKPVVAPSQSDPSPMAVIEKAERAIKQEIERLKHCQGKWGKTPECPKSVWDQEEE